MSTTDGSAHNFNSSLLPPNIFRRTFRSLAFFDQIFWLSSFTFKIIRFQFQDYQISLLNNTVGPITVLYTCIFNFSDIMLLCITLLSTYRHLWPDVHPAWISSSAPSCFWKYGAKISSIFHFFGFIHHQLVPVGVFLSQTVFYLMPYTLFFTYSIPFDPLLLLDSVWFSFVLDIIESSSANYSF